MTGYMAANIQLRRSFRVLFAAQHCSLVKKRTQLTFGFLIPTEPGEVHCSLQFKCCSGLRHANYIITLPG